MTTSERSMRMRKLSPAEIAETPGLDPSAVGSSAHSLGNTAHHDRHEYDLLRVEWIRPSPRNPRKHFDEAGLQELADSIRQVGLLEPVVVRPSADSSSAAPRFELIAGERRWRAAQLAALTDLPAIIRRDVDDALQLRLALVENLQRQDLDPLEEAEGYRQLQELGMTQKAIAEAVHRSQPSIANAIRLLKLPEEVQLLISTGKLSAAHGKALLRYESVPDVVRVIAKVAVENEWTKADLETRHLLESYEVRRQLAGKVAYVAIREHSDYRPDNNTRVPHQFVDELCRKACPFNAYRKLPEGELCFRTQHYEELAAAVKEAAQKAAAKERDRIKATAVKSAAVEVPLAPSLPDKRRKVTIEVGQRVEFDPSTAYGQQGARGVVVEVLRRRDDYQGGHDYRIRLDSGEETSVWHSNVRPLPVEEEERRAVAAQAGLPRLQDLPGSVVQLDMASAPYPCQDRVCACLGQALDNRGQPVFVCTKGRRHQQLLDEYESKRKSQNGLLRLEAERVLDRAVLALHQIGTRELALVAHVLSRSSRRSSYDDPLLTDAALVTAANRSIKNAVESSWRGPEIKFDKLAGVEPIALVRFGMEAVLRTSIDRYYEDGGDTLAKWYFGKEIPDFLRAGWRPPRDGGKVESARSEGPVQPQSGDADELDDVFDLVKHEESASDAEHGFDPDAHLAGEIAAEQERLETEYAAAVSQ